MSAWMGRTALEIVGRVGFGHSFDPLVADTKDEFAEAIKELVYATLFAFIVIANPSSHCYIAQR